MRWFAVRIVMLGLLVGAGVVTLAAPASAHTISGPRPSNYRTRITSVTPEIPGVRVTVVDLGSKLQLSNHTGTPVVVLGYEAEPYLKVGPSGVYENTLSPATYLNRTRNGQTAVPPAAAYASPTAAPQWHKISDAHTVRWHDHRAHWMGGQPPPVVQQSPGRYHDIDERTITMLYGTTPPTRMVVHVTLDWVPGPSGRGWWPLVIAMFAIGLLAGLWKRGLRTMAALVGVLVTVDIVHSIAYEMGRPGSVLARVGQFFGGNFVSVAVWIAAIAVIIGLAQKRTEALYGAVLVGLMVALVGGATDLSSLWKSQLPTVGPAWLTRVGVVVSLGLGLGIAVGALIRAIRTERAMPKAESESWLAALVGGLDDSAVEQIAEKLDADDVIAIALGDLAKRAQPVASQCGDRSIVFVVDGDPWSLSPREGAFAVAHARDEPVGYEAHLTFARLLQVLAGTRALEVDGELGELLLLYLAESPASSSSPDPAPAA
jgi:hypothetical protein